VKNDHQQNPNAPASNSPDTDAFIKKLLRKHPQYFDSILKLKDELGIQIIYTRINRKKNGKISFKDHTFNLNAKKYFYPASTVKLPVAILALQKLNELKIPRLNKYTTMITGAEYSGQTEVLFDSTSENGKPSIAHYIKKILLVSDNDAYNRLYEFLGQEYINNTLHQMGYEDVQVIHRLERSLTEDENRHTNPVKFFDTENNLVYEKRGENSSLKYAQRDTRIGKGFMRRDTLINEPFDFSKKNRLPLSDLHKILRSVIFPESVPVSQRFNLSKEDYDFLQKYMSMVPRQSDFPSYDSTYQDAYVKFLYYGAENIAAEPHIRIFNKPGDAYGFLIDAAYFSDSTNGIEFFLSAVIYCNSDGILNDNHYDYKTVGLPFMKNLGRVVYEFERQKKR
jgi:hypothetical protein